MALVNLVGPRLVARSQALIVFVLLGILGVFIAVTLFEIDLDKLAFSGYPPVSDIIASVALTFFAYLGFSVITFAVGDMRDPANGCRKAMNRALVVTTLLYVLVALGVFGTLTADEVVAFGPTAIAEAARPSLGDAGFTMISIAGIGRDGRLGRRDAVRVVRPDGDARRRRPVPALLRARTRGSDRRAGCCSAPRSCSSWPTSWISLRSRPSGARALWWCSCSSPWPATACARRQGPWDRLSSSGSLPTGVVLAFFAVDTLRNAPETFAALIAVAVLAVVLDLVWKGVRGPLPPASAPGGTS